MDLREELNAELRKARGWLIAVGIIMFVTDMVILHLVAKDWVSDDERTQLTILSGIVMVAFFVLAYFTKKKPKLCLALGLALFWALQLYAAKDDPSMLTKGIVLKIFFTAALIKGLKSATHAEQLQAELGKVFE